MTRTRGDPEAEMSSQLPQVIIKPWEGDLKDALLTTPCILDKDQHCGEDTASVFSVYSTKGQLRNKIHNEI